MPARSALKGRRRATGAGEPPRGPSGRDACWRDCEPRVPLGSPAENVASPWARLRWPFRPKLPTNLTLKRPAQRRNSGIGTRLRRGKESKAWHIEHRSWRTAYRRRPRRSSFGLWLQSASLNRCRLRIRLRRRGQSRFVRRPFGRTAPDQKERTPRGVPIGSSTTLLSLNRLPDSETDRPR